MKIVQVIHNFGLGGIQKAGSVLATSMASLGHETWLIGKGAGDRFDSSSTNPAHLLVDNDNEVTEQCRSIQPDVIHYHIHVYETDLIRQLQATVPNAIRVTTPVFGRPPHDMRLLGETKTCCVGLYCFYRLLRWLGEADARRAIASGIAAVPLTPFQPPNTPLLATDPATAIRERRKALGISADSFVVGRIGRDNPGKWHTQTESLVNQLLTADDTISWLSIGMPAQRGRDRLAAKWKTRFVNLPETSDYQRICEVLSSLDVQVFASVAGECFASSICEPAGLGVPTVAVSTPLFDNGQAEQVMDGVTGFLVGDLEAMVVQIKAMASDPALVANLKKSTQGFVRENWHERVVAQNLLDCYDYWLQPTEMLPAYLEQLANRHDQFRAEYHARMRQIHGGSPFERIRISTSLTIVENWTLHKLAKRARNLFEKPGT